MPDDLFGLYVFILYDLNDCVQKSEVVIIFEKYLSNISILVNL